MSAGHEHPPLELPEHVAKAVDAGTKALAPMVEGCMECARHLAAAVVLAALPELERPKPAGNGHAEASKARRKKWKA